jgi:hypothetical protein
VKITTDSNGVTLHREPGDKRISHESTVTHHIRRLLNERDGRQTDDRKAGTWRRFYPDKVGLTSCRQGVWNGRRGAGTIVYWHERHQIEDAAEQFNKTGKVFYLVA